MIAAFDRHWKDKQYPLSIVKDQEFHSSKRVLEGKAKLLQQAGRGKRPNKIVNNRRRRIAMEGEQVRKYNPRGISKHNVVVTYPAFWPPQPARTSRHESGWLPAMQRWQWVEFVQFTEGQTKTRQGGLHTKHRDFQPRMFARWWRKMPSDSFSAVCESPTSKDEDDWSILPLHQDKQKARWQRVV